MLLHTMLYIVLAYLMLFAALTNSVCLNNASFFFLYKYFLCQGYELSGEIALKNNHYYYYYYYYDMNIHFDNPLQSLTKQTLSTLCLYSLVQVINKPTHRCGHIIDWVIVRPDDDIHRKSTVTDSLESDHYCNKSYFNI